MKIAIPTLNQSLTSHFGHCDKFSIINTQNNRIINVESLIPPEHKPGVLPEFLADKGINVVISGGMGYKAQELFRKHNIEVVVGVEHGSPAELAKQYLEGLLLSSINKCDNHCSEQ